MELASLSYIPTKASLNATAYLENLSAFKSRHPVIFYSDGPVGGCDFRMPNAEVLKGHKNKVAINNFIFLHAYLIAKAQGINRFLFMETDVRVAGDDWDGKIFDEANAYDSMVCAGTPCVWNATQLDPATREAVNRHVSAYRSATGFGLPAFHSRTREFQTRPGNCCLFIMGAGAVYDTEALERILSKCHDNPMAFACQIQAFDLHIGLWCNRVYGSDCVRKLPWLRSMWSGYKDKGFSQEERVELLKSGKVGLVHQFKTNDPMIYDRQGN